MKPILSVQLLLLALSFVIFSCSSSKYAQSGTSEYDDLYFNKGDRYPVMSLDGTSTVVQRSAQSNNGGVGVGYNSKTLNPDYGLPQDAQADAQIETGYAEDDYYLENHDDQYIQQAVDDYLRNNSTTARRSYNPSYYNNFDDVFWSDPLFYQGTIYDPLYRSYYGVYSPFAYRSYYRPYSSFYRPWGPGLSVSIGFGFGSYYGRYYDPFYYGGGFGYGYGYRSAYYGSSYYGSAWCPPSYYGSNNNTVVINNIENTNPGNVRYGTRTSRGSSYIVDNGIIERNTADATSNSRNIRSRADNSVRQASERTLNNSRIVQQDQSGTNLPTRDLNQYDQIDKSRTRFRTHSLDSRNNSSSLNGRTGSNSSLQQRSRTINKDTYRTPDRNLGTRRSLDRNRSYSTSPSGNSGSSRFGKTPSRSPASSGVRSRSKNLRRSSSPSRVGSSNYGRSSSSGRVSSPSRSSSPTRIRSSSPGRSSSPSRIRSSSPSPSRSSSLPSRSSGGATRSVTRE